MLTVRISFPESPIDADPAPNDPWTKAVAAKNWARRADQIDALIVHELAVAIAKGEDTVLARGAIFLKLTAALEYVGDVDIRSTDAAIFYSLSAHPSWRRGAAKFFEKNKIDSDAAFRARPGARLLRAIATAGGAK